MTLTRTHQWRGVLREYADRLDVSDATPIITLGEGGTPLIEAPALSRRTGAKVYVKFEGMNPTGSFKDRGMTMAISKAVEHGAKAVICASTGNTSASAAAYATHAGITAAVLVPEGKIAMAYAVARFAGSRQRHLVGLVGVLALQLVTLVQDASTGGLSGLGVGVPLAVAFYGIGLFVQSRAESTATPTLDAERVHA